MRRCVMNYQWKHDIYSKSLYFASLYKYLSSLDAKLAFKLGSLSQFNRYLFKLYRANNGCVQYNIGSYLSIIFHVVL